MLWFYTTHLSHDSDKIKQKEQRIEQIKRIIKVIQENYATDQLPPIITGDFNFSPDVEIESYELMDTYFDLLNKRAQLACKATAIPKPGIDHIWIGQNDKFTNKGSAKNNFPI